MVIKLQSDDFVLGAIAARERVDLLVEWLASGSYEALGFRWYLVSFDGQATVAMFDAEGGSVRCSEIGTCTGKKAITERLLETIRTDVSGGLETVSAVIFGSEDSRVNTKLLDKRVLLQVVEKGMSQLKSRFDAEEWSKQLGFD